MNSLVAEREVLSKPSKCPWERDTARLVITAMLLPMLLWLIQCTLQGLGL